MGGVGVVAGTVLACHPAMPAFPLEGLRRVLVIGLDAEAVGATVRDITESGDAVAAGYVGKDEEAGREMAQEMLGGVDEVVRVRGETAAAGTGDDRGSAASWRPGIWLRGGGSGLGGGGLGGADG
jgi:hypothetical protein